MELGLNRRVGTALKCCSAILLFSLKHSKKGQIFLKIIFQEISDLHLYNLYNLHNFFSKQRLYLFLVF